MKVIRSLVSILFLLSFLTNCKKEEVNLSQLTSHHNLAIPLVSGDISVDDMLVADTASLVNTGADGELFLVYTADDISFSMDELAIALPDESFDVAVDFQDLPTSIPLVSDTIIDSSFSRQFSIDVNGVTPELKLIDLSSGILEINLSNDMDHDMSITISIPSLTEGGTPYSQYLFASANDVATANKGLINSILDLSQGDLGYNELVIETVFTIISNGDNDTLAPSEKFDLSFSMINMDYDQIQGDLKNHKFDLDPIEIALDIFENSESAINFQLTNPAINFNISNSFGFSPYLGMDAMYYEDLSGLKIDDLLYDSASNVNTPLVSPGPEYAAPFYFPAISSSSSSSTISINSYNSSIDQLINNVPKKLVAQPFLEINPDTTVTNNNTINKNGYVSFSSEILLPLEGYAGGWNMGDTLDFDFQVDSLFSDGTTVDSTEIKFTTTNGWPVDLTLTIELYDIDPRLNLNAVPITSIANQEIILESGLIDPLTGRVTQATIKNTILKCDYDCVQSLNETKHIIISAAASTENYSNQQSVKIYDDYDLKLNMALLVSGKMF